MKKQTDCATCDIKWAVPFVNILFDKKHCLWCLMHSEKESVAKHWHAKYKKLKASWLKTPEGKKHALLVKSLKEK
tara:strand:+ start:1739 stop:1963 length:225 start_codon:yes stop_codon:yes gene_type:complete